MPKNFILSKTPQFWSDWAEIFATFPIHAIVSLTKFHDKRTKIDDFLLIVSFWGQYNFYYSVSTSIFIFCQLKDRKSYKLMSITLVLIHQGQMKLNTFV